jgi:hypothetical protein
MSIRRWLLKDLVCSFSFYKDKRKGIWLERTSSRTKKEFAVFVSSTPKQGHVNLFYLMGEKSCLIHSVECPSTRLIGSYILLENNEETVQLIKTNPPNSWHSSQKVQELLGTQNYTTMLRTKVSFIAHWKGGKLSTSLS